MKAIIKARPEKGLTLGEVPQPKAGWGEILIRVKRGAVCGTDVHIYSWDAWAQKRIKTPLVIGHEFAGVIEEIGPGVHGFAKGEMVSAEGHIVCNVCYLCRTGKAHICQNTKIIGVDVPGAFAEYISMPYTNVWKIDPEIPLEHAAIHDPLGNAFHTVFAGPVSGKTVLVEGCGPIGLFAIGIAKSSGATTIIAVDVNDKRLELARKFGAHCVLNGTRDDVEREVLTRTEGLGAEVTLEMSGNANAIRQALKLTRMGGDVRLLGIPSQDVSLNLSEDVIFKGLTIQGIVGRRMYETWYETRAFLRAKLLDPSPAITHRLHYTEVEKGLEAIAKGEAGKVVLSFE